MKELCLATNYALQTTKVMTQALGQAMSMLVVQEQHLWLYLEEMRDAEKVCFLYVPISQGCLFSDTIEDIAQQFSAVKKQTR